MKYAILLSLLAILPSPAFAKFTYIDYFPDFRLTPAEQETVSFDYTTCCK